jgi:hypothetical protein
MEKINSNKSTLTDRTDDRSSRFYHVSIIALLILLMGPFILIILSTSNHGQIFLSLF